MYPWKLSVGWWWWRHCGTSFSEETYYPTAIVLDFTLGNNWSLHATRLPKNALQRQHKYQTISILPASDRSESTMYSVSGEDFKNGQTHQMARTMELLFPVQQTRANICGIKLMTVKRFSFIWVTFCNGHENCKTFFLQSLWQRLQNAI